MAASPLGHALAGLAALAVAMGIGRFAFTPILPMMQSDGALDLAGGGLLASANYVGYLVGARAAPAFPLAPGRAIRGNLAVVGLTTVLMGFTSSMAAWLALRAVAGVASAVVLVHASSWALARFHSEPPRVRPWLGATLFAGVGTGIAVSGAACLVLMGLGARADAAWIALGVLAIATLALLPRSFGGTAPHASAPRVADREWPAGSLRLVACYGAFGFGYIIPATFLAAMAREVLGDPAVYGWSWPLFGLAGAASPFAAMALARRLKARHLWAAGHLLMAAGVATPLAVDGLVGIGLSALLVGGTFMVVTMAGMQEARRLSHGAAHRLIGAMTAAFAAGQIAGPLAVGALAARGAGYDAVLVAASAMLALSAVALVATPRRPADS
jgi:hypothetical protein